MAAPHRTHKGRLRVLLATKNPAKQAKLRWLLEGNNVIPAVAPRWVPDMPNVAEEGLTHLENAERKARLWSRPSQMVTIASDGGLVIPALGNLWDSLLTKRFAGQEATDRDRVHHLLKLMESYTGDERTAHWAEALAISDQGRTLTSWSVQSPPGAIAHDYDPGATIPGFWAFSIWHLPGKGKTYAELTEEEQANLNDHWGKLKKLVRAFFVQHPNNDFGNQR